ncbi:hypothetical protein [Paracoccus aerius]|uniref:Uncharacterized protein n=1 Tax=Paracoccus aerius TaxID=1915382 RepID=A0ABS1S129_9RHOB|nr:hypothetical protein [Paracoccus aerius]MBL3672269.1 hypothetical protein [Paracoccus aerius]GHG11226.1 hypothetical protein GCM10017322_03380 [Paracoccus aerius]
MQDIITAIIAEQLTEIIITLALAGISAAGTFAMVQLTRLLGEKRTKILSDKLGDAIERAKADAEAKGLNGEQAKAWIMGYVKQTMTGTIRKLKASDGDLAKRISAQSAQVSALEKGIAIGKALTQAVR